MEALPYLEDTKNTAGDQQDGDQTLIMLLNHALEEAKSFSWEA